MLKNLKDKLKTQLEEQAAQLKDKAEKAQADLKNAASHAMADMGALNAYTPEVQRIMREKVLPLLNLHALTHAVGASRMESAFRMAYEFLPAPVRLVVTQEAFVRFCMNNRSQLVDPATEQRILQSPPPPAQRASTADELLKLKQLLDAGLLTQAEFETFKKQLLSA
jgi:molecular chaperone GrpE (heat shock protein)